MGSVTETPVILINVVDVDGKPHQKIEFKSVEIGPLARMMIEESMSRLAKELGLVFVKDDLHIDDPNEMKTVTVNITQVVPGNNDPAVVDTTSERYINAMSKAIAIFALSFYVEAYLAGKTKLEKPFVVMSVDQSQEKISSLSQEEYDKLVDAFTRQLESGLAEKADSGEAE